MAFSGWDIGGAHLKVARTDSQGKLLQIVQLPCALWKGIEQLELTIQEALQQLDNPQDVHAITMTGELVDAFQNRQQGVAEIVDCVYRLISNDAHIYAGQTRWLTCQQAKHDWQQVASMNWQASADFAATEVTQGIFIDIGSTTCDIIPIISHTITPSGLTDHQRQISGELVYTGAIRTPLMTVSDHAFINGQYVRLAAEWFATSGDIWVILGEISAKDIQDSSADGQSWSAQNCQRRLARLLGADSETLPDKHWHQAAMWFAEKQIQKITDACLQVLSQHPSLANTPIIGAGIGRFIVKQCAHRLNTTYIDFSTYCQNNLQGAEHAPATALALLASRDFT